MISARRTAAETVLVGDSVIDWETAQRAATRACVARYGFGFAGFPLDRLDGREWLIDSPRELLSLL
jgi:phosphoglycolate phosphatase-like HAD superfamily hydrolase